jgi:hypothetical protein
MPAPLFVTHRIRVLAMVACTPHRSHSVVQSRQHELPLKDSTYGLSSIDFINATVTIGKGIVIWHFLHFLSLSLNYRITVIQSRACRRTNRTCNGGAYSSTDF